MTACPRLVRVRSLQNHMFSARIFILFFLLNSNMCSLNPDVDGRSRKFVIPYFCQFYIFMSYKYSLASAVCGRPATHPTAQLLHQELMVGLLVSWRSQWRRDLAGFAEPKRGETWTWRWTPMIWIKTWRYDFESSVCFLDRYTPPGKCGKASQIWGADPSRHKLHSSMVDAPFRYSVFAWTLVWCRGDRGDLDTVGDATDQQFNTKPGSNDMNFPLKTLSLTGDAAKNIP
jgi:hypothetical protein